MYQNSFAFTTRPRSTQSHPSRFSATLVVSLHCPVAAHTGLHPGDSPRDCIHLAWQIPPKVPSRQHSPETHSNGYSFCLRISKQLLQMEKRKDDLQNGKRLRQHLYQRPRHACQSTQMRWSGVGLNQQQLYQTIQTIRKGSRIKDQEKTKTHPAISKSRTTNAYSPGVRTTISEKMNTFFPSPSPFPFPFSLPLPLSLESKGSDRKVLDKRNVPPKKFLL